MARSPSSLLVRRSLLPLLIAVLGWGLFTFVRSRVLLRNAAIIKAQSVRFSRDYFVGDPRKPTFNYFVLGDSTAAGWGAATLQGTYSYRVSQAVAARGYRVHVRNIAVGGAKIWDVCRDQLPTLSNAYPDLITLTVGANDATHGTVDGDCIRGLRKLFTAFHASGARTILVANVPDMVQAPALPFPASAIVGKRAARINVALYSEADLSKTRVVDIYAKGKLIYQKHPDQYAADLFHPSAKGYAVWAKLFIESLPEL